MLDGKCKRLLHKATCRDRLLENDCFELTFEACCSDRLFEVTYRG